MLLDLHIHLVRIRKKQAHPAIQRKREIVDRLRVERIRHEQIDGLFIRLQRHHTVIARQFSGERGNRFARKLPGKLRHEIIT